MLHFIMPDGNHERSRIEVHDIVFFNSENIHSEYDRLREL
jgi:hypothetical protein